MVSSDHLEPGQQGQIKAIVKTDGKKGIIVKTVQVRTNDPEQPLVILKLKAKVIDPFHTGQHSADEILRSPCKRCHVDKGLGRVGAALFRADCLMCHRRGRAAPSLSQMRKLPEARLKRAIEEGVPDTMMPGFSFRTGGPLTDTQVRSLIRYIKGR